MGRGGEDPRGTCTCPPHGTAMQSRDRRWETAFQGAVFAALKCPRAAFSYSPPAAACEVWGAVRNTPRHSPPRGRFSSPVPGANPSPLPCLPSPGSCPPALLPCPPAPLPTPWAPQPCAGASRCCITGWGHGVGIGASPGPARPSTAHSTTGQKGTRSWSRGARRSCSRSLFFPAGG